MADVFISYSRKDIAFAHILHDMLRARKLDPWIDWEDIPPSADWLNEVQRAIEAANSFIFILSPTSINSKICLLEIKHALKNHKRIIPIALPGVEPASAWPEIAKYHWIFFPPDHSVEFQTAFNVLLKTIETDLAWVKSHTRLQVRALEWENENRHESFLLRGRDLDLGEKWLAQKNGKDPAPTGKQLDYIHASRTFAESQKHRSLTMLILVFISTIALITLALWQTSKVNDSERVAHAGGLAAQARSLISDQPDLAALLSIESVRESDNQITRAALFSSISTYPFAFPKIIRDTNVVNSVAFSPDGKVLAVADQSNLITLWDVATRQRIGEPLKGHTDFVKWLTFSPDGNLLASSSQDKTIILWDVNAQQPVGNPLIAHSNYVYCVDFSPDGKWLASAGGDNKIIIWDVVLRQPIGDPLLGHTRAVLSVAFSPNGQLLASGSADNSIMLWDMTADQPSGEKIIEHLSGVSSIEFSPDGKMLAFAGEYDKRVMLWDVNAQKLTGQPLEGHQNYISSIAFSPDGKTLASGSLDNDI